MRGAAAADAAVNTDIADAVHVMGNGKEGVNGLLRTDWGRTTDRRRLGLDSDYRPGDRGA